MRSGRAVPIIAAKALALGVRLRQHRTRMAKVIDPPNILDELFHACALEAFVEQARADGGWPDPEATRRKAFAYYEESLASRTK